MELTIFSTCYQLMRIVNFFLMLHIFTYIVIIMT
nr:MAG TPA: hypothetical protein [Caudoviricetes sp.]